MMDPESGSQLNLEGSSIDSVFGNDALWLEAKGKTKLGKLFKKAGKTVKKVTKAVGKAGKAVGKAGKAVGKTVAKTAKAVVQKAKTVGLSAPRAAMQALIRINAFGLASDLKKIKDKAGKGTKADKDKWEKIRKAWYKFGGNRTKFDEAVNAGSKQKALRLKFKKKKGADGSSEYEIETENMNFSVVGTTALIVSATPIIIALISAMGKKPSAMEDDETLNELQNAAKENEAQINQALQEEAKLTAEQKTAAENDEDELSSEIESELGGGGSGSPKSKLEKSPLGIPIWAKIALGVAGVTLVTGIIIAVAKKKS